MSRLHLTHDDRIRLVSLKRTGLKQKDIAKQLGKNPSTISRELSRNVTPNKTGYNVRIAQENTDQSIMDPIIRTGVLDEKRW